MHILVVVHWLYLCHAPLVLLVGCGACAPVHNILSWLPVLSVSTHPTESIGVAMSSISTKHHYWHDWLSRWCLLYSTLNSNVSNELSVTKHMPNKSIKSSWIMIR